MSEDRKSSSDAFAATAVAGSEAVVPSTAASTQNDQRPRDSHVMLEVGKRLGERYDIRGYLGEGGMGAVYRAFDIVLGAEVALKVVRGEYAGEAALRDEVRIAQQVTHENVCRTYDLTEVAGHQLVKMEYIPGVTLARRIADDGALEIDEAVRIARAIAAGLEAAHAKGIVHRDLKPGNVMLDDKRVLLTDFGLARHITEEELDRAGTPGYMSPEQLAGGRVDAASDYYALGCLLYEMLTGKPAFAHGKMTEVAARRATELPPDLATNRPRTPRNLLRATQLLMSNDPAKRRDGIALLVGRSTRRAKILRVIGFVAFGILLGNMWFIYQALKPSPKPWAPTIVDIPITIDDGAIDRLAVSPDGKTLAFELHPFFDDDAVLYTVPIAGGRAERVETRGYEIRHFRYRADGTFVVSVKMKSGFEVGVLDNGRFTKWGIGEDVEDCNGAIVAIARTSEPRGDVMHHYVAPDHGTKLAESENLERLDYPRCDREGKRVVYRRYITNPDGRPGLRAGLWLATVGSPERQLANEDDITPTFTRDGSTLVFMRSSGKEKFDIFARRLGGNTGAERITDQSALFVAPEQAPDGALLFLSARNQLAVFVHTGRTSMISDDIDGLIDFELAATGYITASRVSDDLIVSFDPSGKRTELVRGWAPTTSWDGRTVYYQAEGAIWSIPIEGGKPTRIASERRKAALSQPGFDGTRYKIDGRSWRLDVEAKKLVEDNVDGIVLAWSKDKRAIQRDRVVTIGDIEIECYGVAVWMDEFTIGCPTDDRMGRIRLSSFDIRTGEETLLVPFNPAHFEYMAGRGGYVVTREISRRTVHRMTNFVSRPR